MNILLVLLLLTTSQTLPPAPRKAANNAAGTSGSIQTQTEPNKKPAANSQPPVNAAVTPNHEVVRNEQGADKAQNSIIVSKLPPVVVTTPKRDWADWGYWVFGGLLAVVGFLQVWLLRRTLGAIKRQADTMERQEGILTQSVAAAQDNASAAKEAAEAANKNVEMFISKERARLRIGMKPLDLTVKYGVACTVEFTVSIYGATEAYIVESSCAANVLSWENARSPEAASAVTFPIHSLPNVIPPNTPAYEHFAFLHLDDPDAIIPEITLNRLFVGVRGFIKYRDVFDREREIRFRYLWKFNLHFASATGSWEKCGTEEDNKET